MQDVTRGAHFIQSGGVLSPLNCRRGNYSHTVFALYGVHIYNENTFSPTREFQTLADVVNHSVLDSTQHF